MLVVLKARALNEETPRNRLCVSNMAVYPPGCRWAEAEKGVSEGQCDRSWFYRFGVGSGKLQRVRSVTMVGVGARSIHDHKFSYNGGCGSS